MALWGKGSASAEAPLPHAAPPAAIQSPAARLSAKRTLPGGAAAASSGGRRGSPRLPHAQVGLCAWTKRARVAIAANRTRAVWSAARKVAFADTRRGTMLDNTAPETKTTWSLVVSAYANNEQVLRMHHPATQCDLLVTAPQDSDLAALVQRLTVAVGVGSPLLVVQERRAGAAEPIRHLTPEEVGERVAAIAGRSPCVQRLEIDNNAPARLCDIARQLLSTRGISKLCYGPWAFSALRLGDTFEACDHPAWTGMLEAWIPPLLRLEVPSGALSCALDPRVLQVVRAIGRSTRHGCSLVVDGGPHAAGAAHKGLVYAQDIERAVEPVLDSCVGPSKRKEREELRASFVLWLDTSTTTWLPVCRPLASDFRAVVSYVAVHHMQTILDNKENWLDEVAQWDRTALEGLVVVFCQRDSQQPVPPPQTLAHAALDLLDAGVLQVVLEAPVLAPGVGAIEVRGLVCSRGLENAVLVAARDAFCASGALVESPGAVVLAKAKRHGQATYV